MSAIRINGIRVGHQMFHLSQYPEGIKPGDLLCHTLARGKINLPCIGLERTDFGHTLSCCLEGETPPGHPDRPACMVSVYPHGSKSATLGFLLALFGRHGIRFLHMVSSNAMISFVVDQTDKQTVLTMLERTFDLPPTHTPYEPAFHEETADFVKKRYQETKAYFQEKRIKTYGFSLESGLDMVFAACDSAGLEAAGSAVRTMDAGFQFSLAMGHGEGCQFYCLTRLDRRADLPPGPAARIGAADLVTFHGPHFGDRFGIFNAAAVCLDMAGLDLVLAGCTGASVSLVVPEGQGGEALMALEKGFETP